MMWTYLTKRYKPLLQNIYFR